MYLILSSIIIMTTLSSLINKHRNRFIIYRSQVISQFTHYNATLSSDPQIKILAKPKTYLVLNSGAKF